MSSEKRIGSVLEASVIRREAYGVYLDSEHGEIFVLVPDISWSPTDPQTRYSNGDKVSVRIISYLPEKNLLKGSIKVVAETNPYLELRDKVGTTIEVKVRAVYADALSVILGNGQWAEVHGAGHSAKVGDIVNVILRSVEPDKERVELALGGPAP